jgi:hypothetical protein
MVKQRKLRVFRSLAGAELFTRVADCCTDLPYSSTSISTTYSSASLLNNLMMTTTGQLATNPTLLFPLMRGSTGTSFAYAGRLKIKRLSFRWNIVGSEGTTIANGDLFNRVRFLVFRTNESYGEAVNITAPTIDSVLDVSDIKDIYYDEVTNLQSSAFTSTGFNVPGLRTIQGVIDLDDILEVYSNIGGTQWFSKNYNYVFGYVSDSSVTPNPTFSGSTRIWFDVLDH